MNNRIVTTHPAQLATATRSSLLACGLWMRAVFIGASATAIGVLQLFEGEWSTSLALSTASAGVALTLLSWRRAQAALSDTGQPQATVSGATPAAAHR